MLGTSNVYFFPSFYNTDVGFKNDTRWMTEKVVYGRRFMSPDRPYTLQHAWISAFVMYGPDLMRATQYTDPSLVTELLNEGANNTQYGGMYEGQRGLSPVAKAAQKQLNKLDFLPADFEQMVQTVLGFELEQIKLSDSALLQNYLSRLKSGGPDIDKIVAELVYTPLFGPKEGEWFPFEARIPTAVPRNHLEFVNNMGLAE